LVKDALKLTYELSILHRLDRVTTGILIMGKNKKVNLKIDDDDNQEKMNFSDHSSFFKEKLYLARVHGNI